MTMKLIYFIFIFFLSGCNTPQPQRNSPKGAYASYIHALSTQKYERIYEMLDPYIREKIDETYENIKKSLSIIKTQYPPSIKEKAIESLGPRKYLETKTSTEFFSMLIGGREPPSLSFSERLGSMVKEVIEEEDKTIVVTIAKDRYKFRRQSDGLYYFIPDDEDIKAIQNGLLRSRETLQKIKNDLKKLKNLH